MTTDSRVTVEPEGTHTLEQVVIVGDLAKLTPADRVMYYRETCRSLGLNPLTKPFQYIVLNGRLTLYATRTATDQLRAIKGISIDRIEQAEVAEIYTATVYGHDQGGRTDSDTGAVSITGLKGENRANAIMKAITKGKRRLTLSLAGLGWLDEMEVASIPSAERVDVDQETGEIIDEPIAPITEVIAAKRRTISGPRAERQEPGLPVSAPAVEGPADTPGAPAGATPDAGARTSTPAARSGSDEAGHPSDGASEPAPPVEERCRDFHAAHGRCEYDLGHPGPHSGKDGERWE